MAVTDLTGALEGQVAVVTGAGRGLGEATARALHAAGANVACLDVDQVGIERVAGDLGNSANVALPWRCDVSSTSEVFATIDAVVAKWGRVDIVVNCAAVDHTVWVEEMSVEQWDQVIAVNLRGPFLLAKAAFPHMQARKSGHIVNVASTAATARAPQRHRISSAT